MAINLKTLLAQPPKLHEKDGQLVSIWRIDHTTCVELNTRLKPGMNTLETGSGLSTIIFAANRCRHTCIVPIKGEVDRIQDYCSSASIDTSNVQFVIAKSGEVIHQMSRSAYDVILIDGCHGFPSAFVDFYYATKALRLGGTLIVDDLHIDTCNLIASFMQSDAGWDVVLMNQRVAIGIKVSDTIDNEWIRQPFVVLRSNPPSVMSRPLYYAGVGLRSLLAEGVGKTAKKVVRKLSGATRWHAIR